MPPIFDLSQLNALVYARGFTLWQYRSRTHRLETLMSPGVFSQASGLMSSGDIILLIGLDGAKVALVSGAEFGAVSLSPMS